MINKCLISALLVISSFYSFSAIAQDIERDYFISLIDKTPVLSDRLLIEDLIKHAKEHRVRKLFIHVYRGNKAWFATRHADTQNFNVAIENVGEDPLKLLIRLAHQHNIEVHAWFNLLSLSKNKEAMILKKYGNSILTTNKIPKKVIEDYEVDNQYFLEPSNKDVRYELGLLIQDLLKGYPDLDGVQFDYIRYPDVNPRYGYSPENIKNFKRQTGLKEIIDPSPQWNEFKRQNVTDLVIYLAKKARAIKPNIQVSTTGCMPIIRAKEEAFQDWPKWVNEGLIDFVTVMSYPDNLQEFEKHVRQAKNEVNDKSKLKIGVGVYKFIKNHQEFDALWQYCEQSQVNACVVFHYGNFLENPELTLTLLR